MNYTKTSGEFIKYFLPIFKNKSKTNNDKHENNLEESKLFKIIYNDIYKAYRETINHACLKGILKKITQIDSAKQPEIYNSKF